MEAPQPGAGDYLVAQVTVMACAVEALIACHPSQAEVRRIFDQVFGQIVATRQASVQGELGTQLIQRMAEKFFSPPSTVQ